MAYFFGPPCIFIFISQKAAARPLKTINNKCEKLSNAAFKLRVTCNYIQPLFDVNLGTWHLKYIFDCYSHKFIGLFLPPTFLSFSSLTGARSPWSSMRPSSRASLIRENYLFNLYADDTDTKTCGPGRCASWYRTLYPLPWMRGELESGVR